MILLDSASRLQTAGRSMPAFLPSAPCKSVHVKYINVVPIVQHTTRSYSVFRSKRVIALSQAEIASNTTSNMASNEPVQARKWIVHSFGEFKNLKLEHVTVPAPASDQVRIRVRAVGLNFADVFTVLGLYDPAGPAPLTPGFEACGVIDCVGTDVTQYQPGDRVLCFTRFGGYASHLNVSAELVRKIQDDWTFAEGAAFPAQAFTAWYALFVLGGLSTKKDVAPRMVTSEKKVVLIHSAAGGVGLQLVEMVKSIGGLSVCTIGSENKIQVLEGRGVPRERIIVRGKDDAAGFEKVVREKSLGGEEGFDVIVDSVMGEYFQPAYDMMNIGARYIVMGSASLMPQGGLSVFGLRGLLNLIRLAWKFINRPKLDPLGMINENRTVCGFNASYLFGETATMQKGLEEILEMDLPKPTIGKTFPFEKAQDALEFFQSGKSVGKIVLELD